MSLFGASMFSGLLPSFAKNIAVISFLQTPQAQEAMKSLSSKDALTLIETLLPKLDKEDKETLQKSLQSGGRPKRSGKHKTRSKK